MNPYSTCFADDNISGRPSVISPAGGLDNMTYSALPDQSPLSTPYIQPVDNLMYDGEVYKEVENPLYGSGHSNPEANRNTQHSMVTSGDFQCTEAHYEPINRELNNPLYGSMSLGGNGSIAAHYASDQDEHYSQTVQDK